jgi:hypothetical protein
MSRTTPAIIPDATNLSWLAETADGMRDVDLALFIDDKQRLQLEKDDVHGTKPSLATIRTPKYRPFRVPVTEVVCRGKIEVKDDPTKPDIIFEQTLPSNKNYDAVFWTESSVEKFLYPYYRAHRLWDETMDRLQEQFEQDDFAVAIAHQAPSKSFAVVPTSVEIGVVKDGKLEWMTVKDYLLTAPRSRSKGSRAK